MEARARPSHASSASDEPAAGSPIAATGLVYVTDEMPGIRRVVRGSGFGYRAIEGGWLRDATEIARIRRLAIPPAYRDVWICPLPHGHLQATGRDARGRKQYRYHADWRSARDDTKFGRLMAFGAMLPRLRQRISRDLRGGADSRTAVLAAIVRLLDTTLVRVGNDEYARDNQSFGLTTLRRRHAAVRGATLQLQFRGKSGVPHDVTLDDPRVARIVRQCQALPGQELFQWKDADGVVHRLGSADVNDYLRDATGADVTAKDFRTWHATVHALELLALPGEDGRRAVKEVLAAVSKRLGNTPAVCRKAYIHPEVLALALRGEAPLDERFVKLGCERRLLTFLAAAERAAAKAARPRR